MPKRLGACNCDLEADVRLLSAAETYTKVASRAGLNFVAWCLKPCAGGLEHLAELWGPRYQERHQQHQLHPWLLTLQPTLGRSLRRAEPSGRDPKASTTCYSIKHEPKKKNMPLAMPATTRTHLGRGLHSAWVATLPVRVNEPPSFRNYHQGPLTRHYFLLPGKLISAQCHWLVPALQLM